MAELWRRIDFSRWRPWHQVWSFVEDQILIFQSVDEFYLLVFIVTGVSLCLPKHRLTLTICTVMRLINFSRMAAMEMQLTSNLVTALVQHQSSISQYMVKISLLLVSWNKQLLLLLRWNSTSSFDDDLFSIYCHWQSASAYQISPESGHL